MMVNENKTKQNENENPTDQITGHCLHLWAIIFNLSA